MKFLALVSALLIGKSVAQTGYSVGGTGSVTLPQGPTGGSGSSTGSGSGSVNVVVPTFPSADLSRLNLSGVSTTSVIVEGKNELSTPVRSIPSLFTRFPSSSQIYKFADDGDIAGITKTLQVVASDDSVPCGTKISYLLDLLGAVKDAIRRKGAVADQLATVIDTARAEIARLQDQINRIQKDRDALRLPELDARVNDLSAKLNDLQTKITAVRDQIPPEQARVAGYEKQVSTLVRQNDDERNKISTDRIKLAQTESLIKDLETRLQEARDRRTALQASITNSENTIKDNQKKIDNIRSTIADINTKIRNLQDTVDTLKRQSNTLEVDVDRARTDLSVARVKDDRWAADIRDLQNRINDETPKTNDADLKNLRTLINNLGNVVPRINTDINRQYYYCYGAGKVETQTVGSTIVYVVKGEAFGHYIQNAYGQSVGAPSLRTDGYRLQVVDPYSQVWTAKYGWPRLAGAAQGGSFSCSQGSAPASGVGLVSGVTPEGFTVRDAQGRLVNLSIGSCSRIESTSDVPVEGQQIAWRGVPSSNGGYNIFAATCW